MQSQYKQVNFDTYLEQFGVVGYVEILEHPIVKVTGLPTVFPREVVLFESGQIGQVMSLYEDLVEVLVLSSSYLSVGTRVVRTGMRLQVPVGKEVLGYSLNPLGESLSADKPLIQPREYREVDNPSPDINKREKITRPLETGVTVVDMMIPLGMGQRELIIGDRKTGKTEFLLQSILTQTKKDVICIYAGVGRKKTDIRRIEDFFVRNNIQDKTVLISSSSLDPHGMIFLTPYAAMAMAEYFRDIGRDVLLILDDLTTHAKFYREISLLGRRFPGRSSYPGDIFYTHARLLERAGNFISPEGSKSISCFACAETTEGEISGYIQTNLMSITDGHLYFDRDVFAEGRRPAINYFLSVTRVGRQTQSQLRWDVNRELSTLLALLDKASNFVHFGAELSEGIRTTLETGTTVLNFFNQPMSEVMPLNFQLILFSALWLKFLKNADDPITLKYIIGESLRKYNDDQKFRDFVDNLVGDAKSFNELLSVVAAKRSELLGYLSLPNEK